MSMVAYPYPSDPQVSGPAPAVAPAGVCRILHVEDDTLQWALVRGLLDEDAPGAFVVEACASLVEALQRLGQERPDGILLDIKLRDSAGWETFRRVHTAAPDVPVVIITGQSDSDFAARAVEEGAQDYLSKTTLTARGLLARVLRYAIQRERDRVALARALEVAQRREQELANALESLKQTQLSLAESKKMETIGRLAAGVAHEVKNPLAIVRMGLDYLARRLPADQPAARTTMDRLYDAIRRADAIVAELLDYAAPAPLIFTELSLNQVITDACALVRPAADKKQQALEMQFDAALPTLHLNANKMVQVFVNLLLNAVQATPQGGRVICRTSCPTLEEFLHRAQVDLPVEDGASPRLIIGEILDTGSGIPPHLLSRIFEPFFTTKADLHGTGLGLSIARMIVEMHGGGLVISNRPEGGACACVYFLC